LDILLSAEGEEGGRGGRRKGGVDILPNDIMMSLCPIRLVKGGGKEKKRRKKKNRTTLAWAHQVVHCLRPRAGRREKKKKGKEEKREIAQVAKSLGRLQAKAEGRKKEKGKEKKEDLTFLPFLISPIYVPGGPDHRVWTKGGEGEKRGVIIGRISNGSLPPAQANEEERGKEEKKKGGEIVALQFTFVTHQKKKKREKTKCLYQHSSRPHCGKKEGK